jgi:hypothetical protein
MHPLKPFRLHSLLPLLLAANAPASGAPVSPPSSPASEDDSASAIVKLVDFIAHPTLQLLTWPVQNVLAPGVEVLTYPTQPPIRYFLEENVIERATGLFQFGSRQDLSIYPTISLASGTSSRTGATLRHESPFGRENERLAAYFQYYVNGDYRMRTYLSSHRLGGTPFNGKLAFGLSRMESANFYLPDVNIVHAYALASESYESEIEYPVIEEFHLSGGFMLRNNRYGEAPSAISGRPANRLQGDFFDTDAGYDSTGESRGFNQSLLDRVWVVGIGRDTRTNDNIPLDGSRLSLGWSWHDVDFDHDFHEWRGEYTMYFKLGAEQYEITAKEEKKNGGASLKRFMRRLEYQRLRESIFSRKVLVLHLVGGESYELPGNRMPVYGLQSLGNGTPLRAYPGSRYRNYAMTAASAEYRFPILRIMDGAIFNEYGVFGGGMDELDFRENLRNSWGFGVRVRRPDMFLFRIEMAFHGIGGAVFNATADTPF